MRLRRSLLAVGISLLALAVIGGLDRSLTEVTRAEGIVYGPTYEPAPPTPYIGIKAERRKVRKRKPAYIVVWASPCQGNRGLAVRLLRGGRPNGSRFLSRACTARFSPRVRHRTTFAASLVPESSDEISPESRRLTIVIDHRRR